MKCSPVLRTLFLILLCFHTQENTQRYYSPTLLRGWNNRPEIGQKRTTRSRHLERRPACCDVFDGLQVCALCETAREYSGMCIVPASRRQIFAFEI